MTSEDVHSDPTIEEISLVAAINDAASEFMLTNGLVENLQDEPRYEEAKKA